MAWWARPSLVALGLGGLLVGCGSGPTQSQPPVLHHPALSAVDSVTLAGTPFAVAISPAGVVYVSRLTGDSVARADLPSVTRDNAQLYASMLADGKVYLLDRAARMVVDSVVTGGSPRYIEFNADGTWAVIPNEMGWVTFVR